MGLRLKDDVELDYDEANQTFSIEDLNTAQQFEFNSDGSTSIEPAAHSTSHESGGTDPVDVDNLLNADLKADLTAPDGTVLSSQIPDLAVTETFTVPDQAGRLALTDVQEGDVALQTDTDEGYIFTGGDPSLDANWSLLSNFDPPVDSVFGRVGDVVAQAGDYAASQISNFGSTVLNTIDGASITPNDVTTQLASIGTLDLETISTKTGSQIQYTSGVGGGQTYMLTIDTNTGADIQMTFNGDDASGAYEYWTIDGTRQTNEDVITLADTGGFTRISGYVIISASRFGSGPAFSSNITPGRMNNVVNVASKGGTQGTVALDSIEVDAGPQSNESSLIRLTQV